MHGLEVFLRFVPTIRSYDSFLRFVSMVRSMVRSYVPFMMLNTHARKCLITYSWGFFCFLGCL